MGLNDDLAANSDRRMRIVIGVYAVVAVALAILADLPVGVNEQNWRSQAWMTAAYVAAASLMTVYRVDRGNGLRRTNETLTEMLYVVALFWVTPWLFVVGRVFAAVVANGFTEMRWQWRLYNAVVYAIVSIVLARVFLWIAPASPVDGWRAPLVPLSVWLLNDIIRIGLLSILDWVRFGRARADVVRRAFSTSYVRGIACGFGLLIAIALEVDPWDLTALGAVGFLFVVVSKSDSRAANLDMGINQVSSFSTAATDAQQPEEVERELMRSIAVFGRLDSLAIAITGSPPASDNEADSGSGSGADVGGAAASQAIEWRGRHRTGLSAILMSPEVLLEHASGPATVTADGRGVVNVWLLDPTRGSFLVVETAEPNADHSDLWTIVGHLVDHARLAIDTVYKSQRLTDLAAIEYERARTDPLTHLPNRLAAQTEIAGRLTDPTGRPFSTVLVETLGYQESVDVLGQDFGDAAVLNFAEHLGSLEARGDADYLAHLGASRFLMIVEGDHQRVQAVAEQACLGQHIDTSSDDDLGDDDSIDALASTNESFAQRVAVAGIAAPSELVSTADELVRAAGIALGRASWDERVVSFGGTDATSAERRMSIRFQLGHAIDTRHVVPEFQPQMSLATGAVSGCEVLARWRHHELGQVSPVEFIPVAEQGGQIDRVTLTIAEQAVDAARYWGDADGALDLSVNVSAPSLDSPRFVRTLTRLLDVTGRPPSSTTIEVTESMLVDRASMIAALRRMREIGFRISIDDFGTGYSALSYLDRLPADEVKIDQSMVFPIAPANPVSPVLSHLVELCQALELSVCAEGIEDQYQLEVLRALGCDIGQGYLFSRPLTADAMTAWIAAHRTAHAKEPATTGVWANADAL